MLQAFVFEKVAVLVMPWHEPADPQKRGTRVEVRLLGDEARRGSESAAQKYVIDAPLFRADLFDEMDAPPGNLHAAHCHPHFEGVEPSDRVWLDEIKRDPIAWLSAELADLGQLVQRSGVDVGDAPWLGDDSAAVRDAIPAITTAVQATWDAVRSE